MKHAIDTLDAEFKRLQEQKLQMSKVKGTPAGYRPSEWAMTVSSVEMKRLQTFEALQLLRRAEDSNYRLVEKPGK